MNNFIYSFLGFLILLFVSCSSEEPLGPGDISDFKEVYRYSMSDSVISADSHAITLSMIGNNQPKNWEIWDIKVWTGEKIPDADVNSLDWRDPESKDFFVEGNSFGVDWLSFEKIQTSSSPDLRISVEKNSSQLARGVKLLFGNRKGSVVEYGYIIIIQKPMPDMEAFIMKARYKGKLYSTQAHLNINEEIEYNDSEFSRLMEEIDGLCNVEAIILEDDIVDYFDLSDDNNSKAVAAISHKVDSSIYCFLRNADSILIHF